MAKLTKLPTEKSVDPALQIVLPMGFLASVHSALVLVMKYVANERLQGVVIALSVSLLTYLYIKAYKASQR